MSSTTTTGAFGRAASDANGETEADADDCICGEDDDGSGEDDDWMSIGIGCWISIQLLICLNDSELELTTRQVFAAVMGATMDAPPCDDVDCCCCSWDDWW